MKPEDAEILRELLQRDPSLAGHTDKVARLLADLRALRPQIPDDPALKARLRQKLEAAHGLKFPPRPRPRWPQWFAPSLAIALFFLILTPVVLLLAPRGKSMNQDLAVEDARAAGGRDKPSSAAPLGGETDLERKTIRRKGSQATGGPGDARPSVGLGEPGSSPASDPADLSLNLVAALGPIWPIAQVESEDRPGFLEKKLDSAREMEAPPSRASKKAMGGMAASMGQAASAPAAKAASPSRAEADEAPRPVDQVAAAFPENPFIESTREGVSRLPARIGGGSFDLVRREILAGRFPKRSSVRLEELLNHYRFHRPTSDGAESVGIQVSLLRCPWNPSHLLSLTALEGKGKPGPLPVARGASLEWRWDGRRVKAHRLLGFENGGQPGAVQADQGELRAGEGLVIAHELVPVDGDLGAATFFEVAVQFTPAPGATVRRVRVSAPGRAMAVESAPPALRFAATVLEWGLVLARSPHRGQANFEQAERLARGVRDEKGWELAAEFLDLVRKSAQIEAQTPR
ncbi:MAG: von Willebrand factor type A domain-containing protein [Spirochaetes bacterium]|nr:von Willebrand factor type A domain-containing protein [Spirochaetota bacterium]